MTRLCILMLDLTQLLEGSNDSYGLLESVPAIPAGGAAPCNPVKTLCDLCDLRGFHADFNGKQTYTC